MAVNSKETLKHMLITDPYFGDAIKFVLDNIGDVKNKVVIDSGCGGGYISILFALDGAYAIGFDKLEAKVRVANINARSYNAQNNCFFINARSEEMPIADSSADAVFSRSAMQYMEHEEVTIEYFRVLKPNGILVIIENLRYSPFINIYRWHRYITAKTPAEVAYVKSIRKYLSASQVEQLANCFIASEHREYHFFRILSIYLSELSTESVLIKKCDTLLSKLDSRLFAMFPFLRRFAWFTALICWGKKHEYDARQQ